MKWGVRGRERAKSTGIPHEPLPAQIVAGEMDLSHHHRFRNEREGSGWLPHGTTLLTDDAPDEHSRLHHPRRKERTFLVLSAVNLLPIIQFAVSRIYSSA